MVVFENSRFKMPKSEGGLRIPVLWNRKTLIWDYIIKYKVISGWAKGKDYILIIRLKMNKVQFTNCDFNG